MYHQAIPAYDTTCRLPPEEGCRPRAYEPAPNEFSPDPPAGCHQHICQILADRSIHDADQVDTARPWARAWVRPLLFAEVLVPALSFQVPHLARLHRRNLVRYNNNNRSSSSNHSSSSSNNCITHIQDNHLHQLSCHNFSCGYQRRIGLNLWKTHTRFRCECS